MPWQLLVQTKKVFSLTIECAGVVPCALTMLTHNTYYLFLNCKHFKRFKKEQRNKKGI